MLGKRAVSVADVAHDRYLSNLPHSYGGQYPSRDAVAATERKLNFRKGQQMSGEGWDVIATVIGGVDRVGDGRPCGRGDRRGRRVRGRACFARVTGSTGTGVA